MIKTALPLLALFSISACGHATPPPATQLNAAIPKAPAANIDEFASNLHGVLRARQGNFAYSPASIAMALSMAREGARGETAVVMDRVLGQAAGRQSKELLQKTNVIDTTPRPEGSPMPSEVRVANRIFADGRTQFEPAFLDVTKKDWLAPAEALDFRKDPEAGRLRINGWVATETRDKIKDLLSPGTINPDTRMVLVNAIYMKAQWQTAFTEGATKPAAFWTSATASKQVPMMHGHMYGSLGEHAGAHVLRLPYTAAGPTLSMLVVVPEAKDGMAAVEHAYSSEGIAPFAKALTESGKIDVSMPKYKVTASFELADALGVMGMSRAFSDDADFSGMSQTPLKISKVVHQAFVDVDEKGTEAAAATAVVMSLITSVSIEKHLTFDVDRPFLFFVRDESSGAILFAGRIADPTS